MTTPRRPPGAVRVDERSGRPAWLIPVLALLGLLLLGAALYWIFVGFGDNDNDLASVSQLDSPAASAGLPSLSTAPTPAATNSGDLFGTVEAPAPSGTASANATASAAATATATASASGAGTATASDRRLLVGGQPILPLPEPTTSLAQYVGQPVVANAVPVQSVPADEGFWVGTSVDNRVWVEMSGQGETPFEVSAGDTVSFDNATVVRTEPNYPMRAGVSEEEGASQLAAQEAHIVVPKSGVRLNP